MKRPRVTVNPVADQYHGPRERIVEFSGTRWGGLISLREDETGKLTLELYRLDPSVVVRVSQ